MVEAQLRKPVLGPAVGERRLRQTAPIRQRPAGKPILCGAALRMNLKKAVEPTKHTKAEAVEGKGGFHPMSERME